MTASDIEIGLKQIRKQFRKILHPTAENVLEEAISEVRASKGKYDQDQRQNPVPDSTDWGFSIYPEKPLRFSEPVQNEGIQLYVDLFCNLKWSDSDSPIEQDICLRVWSNDNNYIYRDSWDAKAVYEKLTDASRPHDGRVMLRFHFDRANPEQDGPHYHLQFGGNQQDGELCWFPKAIALPRLTHTPMDLVLACQLVAANFYPDEYDRVKNEPLWIKSVRTSQEALLKEYYQECLKAVDDEAILLDTLWNN